MNEELWMPVEGYDGRYIVSNQGRVMSLPRSRRGKRGAPTPMVGRILKQTNDHSGYPKVCLRDGKCSRNHLVHRLVAEAFIPNPKHLPCINHKDENKENNSVSNLEWCTVAYNNSYGSRLSKVLATKAVRGIIKESYLSSGEEREGL